VTDWQLIFLLLGAIYLSECIVWVPRGMVAMVSALGRKFRPSAPFSFIGNNNGGFIISFPLPPLGASLLVRGMPFSVSSEGVVSVVSTSLDSNGRSGFTDPRFVLFEGQHTIKRRDKYVMIDGEKFVACGSEASARRWTELLKTLLEAKPKARAKIIDKAIAESMDHERILALKIKLGRWSWPVRTAANFVFLQLFAILPAMVVLPHLEAQWARYAIGLGISTLWAIIVFFFAHRSLFPAERGERWIQSFTMFVPTAAVRAQDRLGRRAFLDHHPLAVARVLCKPRELENFARHVLLDARTPIAPACPIDDEKAAAIEADFRARLLRAIEKSIADAGLSVEVLARAPAKLDPSAVAFCPRCRAEFSNAGASCETCGGLALTSF
jgi:hypothetical protein